MGVHFWTSATVVAPGYPPFSHSLTDKIWSLLTVGSLKIAADSTVPSMSEVAVRNSEPMRCYWKKRISSLCLQARSSAEKEKTIGLWQVPSTLLSCWRLSLSLGGCEGGDDVYGEMMASFGRKAILRLWWAEEL